MPDTIANTNFVVTNDSHRAADAVVRQGCAREALAENINALLAAARPRLQRLACKHGVLDDAVDDVVQETLLEAWRHLDHLREPGSFDAWLNGICRNVCMRWTRTQQTKIAYPLSSFYIREDIDDETASMEDIADPLAFDPAEELSRQDMAVLLDRALGYLPGSTREVIELCYLAELPQREAALRLGMTIHALEERLYRARRQLRQLLHTELRSEAESLGLMIDKEDNPGWRKSSQWCQFCGKQRLLGVLESRADGLARLYICAALPVPLSMEK